MKNEIESLEEKSISKLLKIIEQLRDPINGCPWDLKQTHTSLIPYVLEEAHEVADAIRELNSEDIVEELGDLLLQIVLHAQIGKEEKLFCFNDVIQVITNKLIRRHPHVFNNKKSMTTKELNESWEKIKSSEKCLSNSITPISDTLKSKIRSQPAIKGTLKISKTVAKKGFYWENIDTIWEKFHEELTEFKEAIANNNLINAQEELGDLLFTLINVGHWYQLDSEEGLAGTNKRFLERFSLMEKNLNGNLSSISIKEFKYLWQEAKKSIALRKQNLNNNEI